MLENIALLQDPVTKDIISFIAILLLAYISSKIAYFIIQNYIKVLTRKTRTTLDDEIIHALEHPIVMGVLLIGLYIAFQVMETTKNYDVLINKGVFVGAAIWVAYFVVRLMSAILNWYNAKMTAETQQKTEAQFIPFVRRVINIIIYIIAFLIILAYFGVEITPLIASLGIASLAVALALQDTLSNFFAGFYLLTDKPIKVGEYIKLDSGAEGYVEEIGWRSCKIKQLTDNIIIVPNSKVTSSVIVNYDQPSPNMTISIPITVPYDSDLEKVERVTVAIAKDVLKNTKGAVKNAEPTVRYSVVGESYIQFNLNVQIENFNDKYLVTHELIKELIKVYRKENIEFSHPVRHIIVKKPSKKK